MKRFPKIHLSSMVPALCVLFLALFADGVTGLQGPFFSHRLHPCAPAGSRGIDRSRANLGMVAWLSERTLRFEHWLDTYCNARESLGIDISLAGRVITVRETYTGEPVRCRCVYKVSGEARGLRPGRYTIRVLFENRPAGTRSVIEETEITVP